MCDILATMHKIGIIHRDLKSSNIMLQERKKLAGSHHYGSTLLDLRKKIKLMDFGLAKFKQMKTITKIGTVAGTIAYMSPEQALGKVLDYRTDIYSLGVILYEMSTGSLPFMGDNEIVVLRKIINEKPQLPSELNKNISPDLEKIIFRLKMWLSILLKGQVSFVLVTN